MDEFISDAAVDMRVAMFERNFLWHVAALMGLWSYAVNVVHATTVWVIGPTAFLGVFPVMTFLRVRMASMPDQAEAFSLTSKMWFVCIQAIFTLSIVDPSGSVKLVHAALRDTWLIVFIAYVAIFKGANDALLTDPKTFNVKLARSVFFTSLVIKVVVTHAFVYTLFWLGFFLVYEVAYQLVNDYIDSRMQLAALTERNEQLVGEKERMDYERRMQRNVLDTSGHDRNILGALLGAMQDPNVTAGRHHACVGMCEFAGGDVDRHPAVQRRARGRPANAKPASPPPSRR